jgi:hypothetical protein
MTPTITIGADPEFFVRKGNHYISAHEFPFGTKTKPQRTLHGHIQIDGVAVECNVRPSKTRDEFIENTRGVIEDATSMLDLHSNEMCTLVTRPSIFFGRKKLHSLPQWAGELGCRPDFDAYTGRQTKSPDPNTPFRTASGHIHIGWTQNQLLTDKSHFDLCRRIVKQLDYVLGLPSLLWDKDKRRRELYGQAGAFRPKPYGLEYRVLSNKWTETEKHIGWVFDAALTGTLEVLTGGADFYYPGKFGVFAQAAIRENDDRWFRDNPALAEVLLQ